MLTYIEIILLGYIFSLILTRDFYLLCALVSLAEKYFPKTPSPKPARIPPQTPPAGGKSAEAGQIQNPRKIVCPAESVLFPFHSLGFSAKWVLTFSNKHHHSEFAEEIASGLRPSALVSAKKFQGVLNSAKRIPAESRRFPNEVWIVPKAQEPMNRDFKIVGVMQNLLSI